MPIFVKTLLIVHKKHVSTLQFGKGQKRLRSDSSNSRVQPLAFSNNLRSPNQFKTRFCMSRSIGPQILEHAKAKTYNDVKENQQVWKVKGRRDTTGLRIKATGYGSCVETKKRVIML